MSPRRSSTVDRSDGRFIDDHRATYGVEPICAVLPIAPPTYFRCHAQREDPTHRSARARRDDELRIQIQRVYDANFQVYGPRKVWRELRRGGVDVARCTVERLMRAMGVAGVVRGRAWSRPPSLSPLLIVPAIWSTASFRPRGRISSGCRTSRTWRRGRALSTSRSSSMSLPAGLSAGACPRRCGRISCWTRSNKRSTRGAAHDRPGSCITVIKARRVNSTGRRDASTVRSCDGNTETSSGTSGGTSSDAVAGASHGGTP